MPEGGSSIYTDAEGYQASMRDMLDLLVPCPREFHARLSWADLPNLRLIRAAETSARVGYMTLPPHEIFVTFPVSRHSVLISGGIAVRFGDIMLHSRGERRHQRTAGACAWASIAMTPARLSGFARSLSGRHFAAPPVGQIVRPRRADGRQLLALHARAARVVERSLPSLTHAEVVRALEQDLIAALITCLVEGNAQPIAPGLKQKLDLLSALEEMLAATPHRLLRSRDLARGLGISEATLRADCARILGMAPGHYQRLRRLRSTRAALPRDGSLTRRRLQEVVNRCGFPSLDRFVTEHWRFYGEVPSISARDAGDR